MKEKRKISLVTYVISLIIMALFVVIIMIALFKNQNKEEYNIRAALCNSLDDSISNMIVAKNGTRNGVDFIEIDSYKRSFLKNELRVIINEAEELKWKKIEKELDMTDINILNKMKEHSLILFDGFELYAYDGIKDNMNVILLYADTSKYDFIPEMELYKTEVAVEDYIKMIYDDWTEVKGELKSEEVFYATGVEKKNNEYVIKGKICTKYKLDEEDLKESIKNNEILITGTVHQIEEIGKDKYKVFDDDKVYYIYKEDGKYYLKTDKLKYVWRLENPSSYQITLNKKVICEDNDSKEKETIEEKFINFKEKELENINFYNSDEYDEELIESQEFYKFEFRNGEFTKLISLNI